MKLLTFSTLLITIITLVGCDDQNDNSDAENNLNLTYNLIADDSTDYTIEGVRVFESTTSLMSQEIWDVVALAKLPAIDLDEEYPSSYKDLEIKANESERGRFNELNKANYEVVGDNLLINDVSPDRTYAVSYIIHNDPTNKIKIGGFIGGSNSDSIMALQLVKRPYFDVIKN